MAVDIEQLLPDEIVDALFGANSPSAGNVFVTFADLDGNGIYGGSGSLQAGTTTVTGLATDNLVFTGATVKSSHTSGGNTVYHGSGTNPIGFALFGHLDFIDSSGSFDSYGGNMQFGGDPFWTSQIYDNTTFVENAQIYNAIADWGGTDRPYAGIAYTADLVSFNGFEANPFGERILSKSVSLGRLDALGAPNGIAFLSGAGGLGYIGTASQLGVQDWMNNGAIPGGWGGIYEGSGTTQAGTTTVTQGGVQEFDVNGNAVFRIKNTAAGGTQFQVHSTNGIAYVQVNAITANLDSYIHFANGGVNEITIGWDDSAGMFRMGTNAITAGTFYEYNPTVTAGRHIQSLGVGGTFPGAEARLKVRGQNTDVTTTYGLIVEKGNGIDTFKVRDDGYLQHNTSLTQLSGIGGAYGVTRFISDNTTTIDGAAITTGFGHRTQYNPATDSTVRGAAARFSALKTSGSTTVMNQMYGVYSEAMNLGSGNLNTSAISGIYGIVANARNQYAGASVVDINQMWAFYGGPSNQSGAGNNAVVDDFGGMWITMDGNTNLTATRMVGVRVGDPVNNTGAVITETRGIWLESMQAVGTQNFGIYQQGNATVNWFEGNVTIGGTTATDYTYNDVPLAVRSNGTTDATTLHRFMDSSGNNHFTQADNGQMAMGMGMANNLTATFGGLFRVQDYVNGIGFYSHTGVGRTILVQHVGSGANHTALDSGFQGAPTGTATAVRGFAGQNGPTTAVGINGLARNSTGANYGVFGQIAGGWSGAGAASPGVMYAVYGIAASGLDADSTGVRAAASSGNAGGNYSSTWIGLEATAANNTVASGSTSVAIAGSFRTTTAGGGGAGRGNMALNVPLTGNDGTVVINANAPSANASMLEVHDANIEIINSSNGLILESPDNTRWLIQINNAGSLTFTSLP